MRPPKQLHFDEVRPEYIPLIMPCTTTRGPCVRRQRPSKSVSYISSRSIRKPKVCALSARCSGPGVIRRTVKVLRRKSSKAARKKRVTANDESPDRRCFYTRSLVLFRLVPSNVLSVLEEFGSSGHRVLALAYKDLPRKINWKSLYHLKLENVNSRAGGERASCRERREITSLSVVSRTRRANPFGAIVCSIYT